MLLVAGTMLSVLPATCCLYLGNMYPFVSIIQQQTGNKLAKILLTATSNMLPATCFRVSGQHVALV